MRSRPLSGASCCSGAMGLSTRPRTRASRRARPDPGGRREQRRAEPRHPHRLRRRRAPRRPGCRAAARRDLGEERGTALPRGRGRQRRLPRAGPLALHGRQLDRHPRRDPRRPLRRRALRAAHRRALRGRRVPPRPDRPAVRREHAALRPGPPRRPADPADGLLDVVTIDGGRGAILAMLPASAVAPTSAARASRTPARAPSGSRRAAARR